MPVQWCTLPYLYLTNIYTCISIVAAAINVFCKKYNIWSIFYGQEHVYSLSVNILDTHINNLTGITHYSGLDLCLKGKKVM